MKSVKHNTRSVFLKLFSSPVLGNEVRFLNTLTLSSLIKNSSFACLASSIARSISVSVMLAVVIVSGPVLLAFLGEFWGSLNSTCLLLVSVCRGRMCSFSPRRCLVVPVPLDCFSQAVVYRVRYPIRL